jgi:hypothetical protein
MQPSLDHRQRAPRRLQALPTCKGRWIVNEYPAGYLAQLARLHAAAKAEPAQRGASSGHHPQASSAHHPQATSALSTAA